MLSPEPIIPPSSTTNEYNQVGGILRNTDRQVRRRKDNMTRTDLREDRDSLIDNGNQRDGRNQVKLK